MKKDVEFIAKRYIASIEISDSLLPKSYIITEYSMKCLDEILKATKYHDYKFEDGDLEISITWKGKKK